MSEDVTDDGLLDLSGLSMDAPLDGSAPGQSAYPGSGCQRERPQQ